MDKVTIAGRAYVPVETWRTELARADRAEAILRGLEAKTMASKDDPEGELTASGATVLLAWLADLRAQVTL